MLCTRTPQETWFEGVLLCRVQGNVTLRPHISCEYYTPFHHLSRALVAYVATISVANRLRSSQRSVPPVSQASGRRTRHLSKLMKCLAPRPGLEPGTCGLTGLVARRSAPFDVSGRDSTPQRATHVRYRPILLKNSCRAFRAAILRVFKPSTGSFASLRERLRGSTFSTTLNRAAANEFFNRIGRIRPFVAPHWKSVRY